MTSVVEETRADATELPLPAVRASIARRFAEAFERGPRDVELAALDELAPALPAPA